MRKSKIIILFIGPDCLSWFAFRYLVTSNDMHLILCNKCKSERNTTKQSNQKYPQYNGIIQYSRHFQLLLIVEGIYFTRIFRINNENYSNELNCIRLMENSNNEIAALLSAIFHFDCNEVLLFFLFCFHYYYYWWAFEMLSVSSLAVVLY